MQAKRTEVVRTADARLIRGADPWRAALPDRAAPSPDREGSASGRGPAVLTFIYIIATLYIKLILRSSLTPITSQILSLYTRIIIPVRF